MSVCECVAYLPTSSLSPLPLPLLFPPVSIFQAMYVFSVFPSIQVNIDVCGVVFMVCPASIMTAGVCGLSCVIVIIGVVLGLWCVQPL